MSNLFNLDSMREEITREFAPFQLEIDGKVLTLQNLLRVKKKNREEVYALLDQLAAVSDEEGSLTSTEQSAQIALKILPLVADNEKLANILVENIEEDLALSLRVFSKWIGATQAGEPEGSQS